MYSEFSHSTRWIFPLRFVNVYQTIDALNILIYRNVGDSPMFFNPMASHYLSSYFVIDPINYWKTFENIVLSHIHAYIVIGYVIYPYLSSYIYPVIFIQLYIFHGYVVIYPYLSSSVASHSVGHCSSRWSRRCGDREFGWEITGHEIPTQCGWQTQGQVPRQVVWENHIGKTSEILGNP